MDPARLIGRESARRNDAMEVRMEEQVLSPRVQDAEEADLRSEVFRIRGDFEHGCRAGAEQQVVQDGGLFWQSGSNSCGSVNTTWK